MQESGYEVGRDDSKGIKGFLISKLIAFSAQDFKCGKWTTSPVPMLYLLQEKSNFLIYE